MDGWIGHTSCAWNVATAAFDASVLPEIHVWLAESGTAERLVFEAVRDRLAAAAGWIRPGGRQCTNFTHGLAVVRLLQRLERSVRRSACPGSGREI